ncbi:MAG: calcium/sodium antiporter, partial [Mariniblastus sp.]|nr:calcium/sodium antiporter [Mariniblastus sp.]
MILPVFLILAGLVLLVVGGELLVRGASRVAQLARIDPLLVGLTIVALGTSAPEMAVCLYATFSGQADMALGNVIGSNIANVLLILGISAMVAPLVVNVRLVRLDVPVMIVASLALLLMGWTGQIGRLEGGILLLGLVAYMAWLVWQTRQSKKKDRQLAALEPEQDEADEDGRLWFQLLLIAVSIGLLVLGSNWLVQGASSIARLMGVSDLVIGLTIVAVGTSLPELAASLMAVLRGRRDLAVGNCVGSNILNILAVMGLTGLLAPDGVKVPIHAMQSDLPIMVVVAIACLPVFSTGGRISRWEGFVFFGYFLIYMVWLFFVQTDAPGKNLLGYTIVGFVIPLTVITFTLITYRS